MEGNFMQLQQKIQNLKVIINELNRLIEKKESMVVTLNEQVRDIQNKINLEDKSLKDDNKKKEELQRIYDEATSAFTGIEEASSSLLAMINNRI